MYPIDNVQTIHESTISRRSILPLVAVALAFAGCSGGGDKTSPVTRVLSSVTIGAPQTTISTGAAVQLTATAKDQFGSAIAANVAWSSSASGTASVSVGGLVTGVAAGAPVTITATATAGDSTATNTVLITVVVPVLSTTTINAPSTSVSDPGTLQLTVTNADQNGFPIAATVVWGSSAPGIATVGHTTGLVTAVSVGTTTITDTATAGGVTITSSQVITVAVYPTSASVNATAGSVYSFDPSSVDIKAGGTVTWSFFGVTHNVTFNAGAGAPGNIGDTTTGSATATFTTAGTFNYHCSIHPYMTGTVIVH